MFRSLLGGRSTGSSQSLSALDEPIELENAMQGASYIMDDEVELAEEALSKGNTIFHKHGKCVVSFLRATLGFEREIMKEASERLAECESAASEAHSHAQRYPESSAAKIYSPGTEYALIVAEVRLMSAIIGVLTESVTEAIRGFYKLRQAYLALDAIQQEEKRYLEKNGLSEQSYDTPSDSTSLSSQSGPMQDTDHSTAASSVTNTDDEGEFVDADEEHNESQTEKYLGRLSTDQDLADDVDKMTIKQTDKEPGTEIPKPEPLRRMSSHFAEGPGMDIFGDNIVDAFIHSGSNMCFGIIQILLSMLPPAFNTLIKIAGFKGDRLRGLALLWQATKFTNINGAFAGLVLLGYYNGFVSFCDILPIHGKGAYPEARCAALLASFRSRYPKSRLWILEEARGLSSKKNIEDALQLLEETPDANLKQIRALQSFEKAMGNMYLHRYELCSENFQRCVKLNNWSHGLYYYVAASACVERYRELKGKDQEGAEVAKAQANELLKKVPEHLGKKRMMGRQLPFDVFVGRKIQKWEHRAKEWQCDLVDAVGVSPIEEMIFFWNGFKRMTPAELEVSLQKLDWVTTDANPYWSMEGVDEQTIRNFLRAVVLRSLDRRDEAKELLNKEVMNHQWHEFKGGLKDNWTLPSAHYEMSVIYWKDYCSAEIGERKEDLDQAKKFLDKAAGWESYDLDARIGMRIKTGAETIRKELEAISE